MNVPTAYPYATGDLLDHPQTYFYSAYQGKAFLHAWRSSRAACRGAAALPVAAGAADGSPPARFLAGLAVQLPSPSLDPAERKKLDALLRNFEAKKRLYEDYHPGYTSKDRTDFRALGLYIAFAEVLVLAYRRWQALPYLNALLKCADILCAMRDDLSAAERQRLADIIAAEAGFIAVLSDRLGVEL